MKKILLTLLAFMATVAVNAEQVTKKQALQKAQQFMPGKQFGEGRSFARSGNLSEREPFYVFNARGNQGFVIVSGDDRTTEILGYSKTGSLDLNRLPENLKGWLDGYARQIEALGTSTQPVQRAKTRGAGSWEVVNPLIQTKWNQHEPYNLMCPDGNFVDYDKSGYDPENRCVTGCVATAMAQVMYYWEWPSGCDAIDGYDVYKQKKVDHSFQGLPATTFDWESMALTYPSNATGVSANAVAKLLRYCGQAVHMNYGTGGSSAHVSAEVMAGVFGYSKKCRELYRDPYTTSQWEEMVYAELAAGRPVLYSGDTDDGGGHEFIVDGYDGNGLFHMNWGWGGMSDDYYFVLSLAEPKVQGAGGSNGAYQFDQSALFGVEPGSGEETLMPKMESNISSMATAEYTRASADVDFTNVVFNGIVYITLNTPYTTDKEVQFGWALCQNGQVKLAVPSKKITLSAGQTYTRNGPYTNTKATLGAGLELGKYDVCQVYRFTEDDVWSLCDYYWNPSPYPHTAFLVADVTETTLTVRQPVPSFKVNTITTTEYPSTDSPLDVTLNVTNDGETFEQVMYLWVQKEGEDDWTPVAKATRKIDPGKSEDVVMSYKPTVAGNYTLKITNAVSEDALKTTTVTVYATFEHPEGDLIFVCHPGTKKAKLVGHTYGAGDAIKVEIPATIDGGQYTVTEIADGAFDSFYRLSAVTIPATVETIGDGAFWNDYLMNEIVIPAGVKRIGASAFRYCFGLRSLELPASLTSIGENAFGTTNEYGTSNRLTSVVSYISIPFDIADNVFGIEDGGNMLAPTASLTVPYGSKTKYEAAAGWKLFQPITEMEPQGTPGDASGNGTVGPEDIDAVVNYIMTGNMTGFNFDNANLNGDDKVDAADLVLLINMVK